MVLASVAVHLQWVRTAERAFAGAGPYEGSAADSQDIVDDAKAGERAKAAVEKRYRAEGSARRTGATTLRIVQGSGTRADQWHAAAKHRLVLDPDDPMTGDLRRGAEDPADWLPVELGITTGDDECATSALGAYKAAEPFEQDGPKKPAYAYARADMWWFTNFDQCGTPTGGPAANVFIILNVKKGLLGDKGLYDHWKVTVESPDQPIIAVEGGTTLRQSAARAELILSAKGKVYVSLGRPRSAGTGSVSNLAALGAVLQSYRSPNREAAGLLFAVAAVTCCLAVPFVRRWAPLATRTRWTAAAVTGGALTGATLMYALAGSDELPWSGWWEYAGRGMPLVVWWWVVLPLLLAAFGARISGGRPPRVRQLLPLLLPSLLLVWPVVLLAERARSAVAAVPIVVAAASAGLVAHVLRRRLLGPAGRRWAATAAAGVWLAILAAGPGTGLPDIWAAPPILFDPDAELANQVAMGFLSWCWPVALWPVLASLVRGRWVAATVVLFLWWALAVPDADVGGDGWTKVTGGPWVTVGIHPTVAANLPLVIVETTVLGGALLLAWQQGRMHGVWPVHVRTVVGALGVAAVGSQLTRVGFSMFDGYEQTSGACFAVGIAALGFAWLLPPAAESRALRLHSTRAPTHNRLVHALLKDETLAAGRREFLSSSRTALAAGDLTARQWSTRWHALGALGARATAPHRSVALRAAALGTSGGRSAWRNGVAAAVLLTGLTLPWLLYTLPSRLTEIGYDLSDIVDVWTNALRWSLYGFVYGYAYSWLRGGTPIGKALCLLAVVLPAELAELLYQDLEPGRFGISLLLTAGNCLAVFLVLGLYWEARLVRAAGLRWGQIRNFRSLSATAVPATTVLVAAATALATAMVGVWVSPEAGPDSNTPTGQSSVSGSPTPGAEGH